jgi:hypothetical protein
VPGGDHAKVHSAVRRNDMWFGIQTAHETQEMVTANVIEFYIPKNFRSPGKPAAEMENGKVIEFRSPSKKSA